jgi:hypothetical protein
LLSSKLPSTDNASLTRQDIKISNTKRTSQNVTITPTTILPRPLTKQYNTSLVSSSTENIPFATNQQNNIHIVTRQSFLTKQNILSQNCLINTIKKNKKDNNHKDKKKSKKEKQDVGSPTKKSKDKKELKRDIVDSQTIDPLTKIPEEKAKHKLLCYKCNKLGHY